jgi:trimeric autotransporter adhesin
MSTKTLRKRIALVAVSALGFGLLSAAPSSATDTAVAQTPTITGGTDGTTANGVSVVYNAGVALTATINVATATTMSNALDRIGATVTVTGPSIALPNNTDQDIAETLTAAATTATLSVAATATTLTGSWISGSSTSAQALGTVTFIPTIPGIYTVTAVSTLPTIAGTARTGTAATATQRFIVGSQSVVVPTVGTSISAANVVGAQTGGQATWQFRPSRVSATTTYFATVDNGSIVSAVSAGASGATGTITTSHSNTNGLNTAGGLTLVSTLSGAFDSGANANLTDKVLPSGWTITVTSPVDATQTLTIRQLNTTTGAVTTVATAVATFGGLPAAAAALSTAFIGVGTAFPVAEAAASTLRFPSTANSTVHATIGVTLNDANGVAINGQSITATVSGPGLITATAGNGSGAQGTARSVSITAAAQTTNQFRIGISADGTRGVSTITILRGTTVIATKTVTFHGAVATLTATQGVGIMRSGRTAASTVSDFVLGGSNAAELATAAITRNTATNISIVAADVDGNVVPGVTVTADISDITVISDVTITSCANGGATTVCAAGAGNFIASTTPAIGGVSGAKATVTFKTPNPAVPGGFISTAALPFSLGGTATGGTVTMTLDKATYEPGERMIITYTARDAAGNPVRDWTAVGTPASNKAIVGLNGAGVYVNGSHIFGDGASELTYAPATPGPFVITLASGTSATAMITATATVGDDAATTAAAAAGDAAAEATDAANAATDAANAAAEAADAATAAAQDAADAVAALSTSVTAMVDTLRKQITSLTNLVIKIQRKVRA